MKSNVNPQGTVAAEYNAAEQIEEHLARLPESRRRGYTLLGVLMLIGMVATVGLMIWAIYASIRSNTFGIEYVPFWWFVWAASSLLSLAIFGLATVVARASPPFVLGRSKERIQFGLQAVRQGWRLAIGGLLGAGVFAVLAIYVGVTGVDLFEQFITGVVIFSAGLGLVAAFTNIVRAVIRSLRRS